MSEFSDELRRLLGERGMSTRECARQVPCDPGYVSKLASGAKHPSQEMAGRLDGVLGAGGALAALAPPERVPADLLAGFPVPCADRADARFVEALRATSQSLVRIDTSYGSGDVLPITVRAFRFAAGMLAAGAHAPGIERDLQAACGEAGEVAAWMAYDADRHDLSRQLAQEAMFASRLAGDRDMELLGLSQLAIQDVYLHRGGEALRIAEHVLEAADLAPRVTALFELRRGRALAQLGDLAGATAAIRRARSVTADGITRRDPSWTWWVDESEIACHEGLAHAEAGDWSGAVSVFQQSSAQRTAERSRDSYRDQAHLLNALAHVGAWADAERVAIKVTGMSGAISSPRTASLLRKVARRMVKAGPPATADVARQLVGSLAGPPSG